MDSSSRGNTASSRRPRKSRQLVVPADTLLQFAHYNPQNDAEQRVTRDRNRNTAHRRRDQFAQANYRFAVDPHYDQGYSDCTQVPDAIIPWSAVDIVFMQHSHDCPICLHPLRCPRVTPCGHVFDFVCMVQHFSHSGDGAGFAKCPLCFSRIRIEDLKACVLRQVQPIEVGRPCTMRLISRQRGHMLAHMHPTDCHLRIPTIMSNDHPLFSRLAFADENYLLNLMIQSMCDLRQARREDRDLSPFVEIAMDALKKSKHTYRKRRAAATHHHHQHQHQVDCGNQSHHSADECKVLPIHGRDPWYFYQVKDSRNIFLHPVNHRCIVTEVSGDFTRIEPEICGVVLQVERYTMTERLRRRYRVLEHLPLGCEFSFVELDLSHIISDKTKATHIVELRERSNVRRKQRISAAREDRIAAKRRSDSFQEHLAIHSEGLSVAISANVVDGRDPNNFPALCANPASTLAANTTSEDGDQERNEEQNFATSSPSLSFKAWGADVSSYSSVTSNMGLFPSLEDTTGKTPPRACDDGPVGQEGNANDNSLSNSSMSRELYRSVLHSRGGRKNHGRSKILWSNHGSACRP